MSRLGLSYDNFLDVTPKELTLALDDHSEYRSADNKHLMNVIRYFGTVLRNKGLKEKDQVRDPRRLYPFYWEADKSKEVTVPDWKSLDKKYSRPAR